MLPDLWSVNGNIALKALKRKMKSGRQVHQPGQLNDSVTCWIIQRFTFLKSLNVSYIFHSLMKECRWVEHFCFYGTFYSSHPPLFIIIMLQWAQVCMHGMRYEQICVWVIKLPHANKTASDLSCLGTSSSPHMHTTHPSSHQEKESIQMATVIQHPRTEVNIEGKIC